MPGGLRPVGPLVLGVLIHRELRRLDGIRPGRTGAEGAVPASRPSPCFPRTCPGTRAAPDALPRAARSSSLARRTGAPPFCPNAHLFPQSKRVLLPFLYEALRRGHVTECSRDRGRRQHAQPGNPNRPACVLFRALAPPLSSAACVLMLRQS